MKLIKLTVPEVMLKAMESASPVRKVEVFRTDDGIGIISSEDNTPKWGWLKHVSVSRQDRYPSWEEILAVKQELFGDIDCMMVMPQKKDYVNLHEYCFHIWQTPEEWGLQ